MSYPVGGSPRSLATGDLDGDGAPDLAVANFGSDDVCILLGNGNGTFQPAVSYPAGNRPRSVAIADLDGDGAADLVVANFYSGDVSILLGNGDGTFQAAASYSAGYSPQAVAIADLNGDGTPDLAVANDDKYYSPGAGPGEIFGPHVRGFDYDGASVAAIPGVNFFAYGTLKYGVNPGSGDVDGDRYAEILTGPGPGSIFGPQVRGFNFDGGPLGSIGAINFNAFSQGSHGAVVAGGDVDADGFTEMAASPGPGQGNRSRFLGYNYDGKKVSWLAGFDVRPYSTRYGGRLALADMDADNRADLITGPGPDPAAQALVRSFSYDGTSLAQRPGGFTAFTSMYGVNVGAGSFGW